MALLQLSEARSHCRLEDDYPDEQLQPYMDAAESYVIAHLNRAVYTDQITLDAALDSVATTLGAAATDYQEALDSAKLVSNPAEKGAAIAVASARYDAVKTQAQRTMAGIVMNSTIRAAMLLTLGNLFANRETDVVGVSVAALPTGVPELLRPYRIPSMP